jgi:hypothetical protein
MIQHIKKCCKYWYTALLQHLYNPPSQTLLNGTALAEQLTTSLVGQGPSIEAKRNVAGMKERNIVNLRSGRSEMH